MDADNPELPQEQRESWLAACDDALAAGETPGDAPTPLARDVAFLRQLRQALEPASTTPQPPVGPDVDLPVMELGRFRIVRELGRGSFGVVFLAHDPQLNREVALKVPRAEALVTPVLRQRFQREARAAAGLEHPNIVPVHEAGEVGPVCYIASAYCPGPSLAQWLRQRTEPVPFPLAAGLVESLARAVQHAHDRGVVHRDLKPGNILLQTSTESCNPTAETRPEGPIADVGWQLSHGTPRITDFGLAKLTAEAGAEGQTQSGAVVGTPSYMAPEQAGGKSKTVGPLCDVYPLGTILYELLTGRPPFIGETTLDVLLQVQVDEPVPPSRLRPRLPRDLETICLKCLHKDPRKRYASSAALADDLRHFLSGEPIVARPVGVLGRAWRWCKRKPLVAGLTATVALLMLGLTLGSILYAFEKDWQAEEQRRLTTREKEARIAESSERDRAEKLLERSYVERATRSMGQGQPSALPWVIDGLRLAEGYPERERPHRYRFASITRQAPELLRAWFHDSTVVQAEFSPDGRRVLTACEDGTAHVWDATSGARIGKPLRHGGAVKSARFNSDGRRVVTASQDKTARIWDTDKGEEVTPSLKLADQVFHAEFSPDDSRLVTACKDGMARQWNAVTGAMIDPPLTHKALVHRASYRPDGQRIVTASEDRSAQVWDAATGTPVGKAIGHLGPVWFAAFNRDGTLVVTTGHDGFPCVSRAETGERVRSLFKQQQGVPWAAFSPDGHWLATASLDGTSRLWEFGKPNGQLRTLQLESPVYQVVFSPDGQRVVTAGADRMARQADVAAGAVIGAPMQHSGRVLSAVFSPSGKHVLTASEDHTARLWSVSPRPGPIPLLAHGDKDFNVAFSPDGRRLFTGGWSRGARVWNADSGELIANEPLNKAAMNGAVFSPDWKRVLTWQRVGIGGMSQTASVWNAETGETICQKLGHDGVGFTPVFSPDGPRVMMTRFTSLSARVLDVETGKPVSTDLQPQSNVTQAAFSPVDPSCVAFGCRDGVVWIWHYEKKRRSPKQLPHPGGVNSLAFSPDGRRLLVACGDSGLPRDPSGDGARVWDVDTGTQVGMVMAHVAGANMAAFNPDASRVVTASHDGTACVWNASTGDLICKMNHGGTVTWAGFSPDGQRVATASTARTVRVWHAVTGEALSVPLRHPAPVWHAAFSPDGNRLVAAASNGTAHVWELAPDDRPVSDLALVAETLAGVRLQAPGKHVPLGVKEFHENWATLRKKYPRDYPSAPPHRFGD